MLLSVQDVRGGYGESEILQGISLSVDQGEIVTLAGTNGSGKSTMGRAIMGLLPKWQGRIVLDGKDIGREPTSARITRGLFYVPQVANVFPSLTVRENLRTIKRKDALARTESTLDLFPALRGCLKRRAGSLSGGERQQLAIARGLIAGARLVILDEPTANLAPKIVDQVLDLIQTLPSHGVAVLLIEQRAHEAFAISTRGYVMHVGKLAASGSSRELIEDPQLGFMFFGMVPDHH